MAGKSPPMGPWGNSRDGTGLGGHCSWLGSLASTWVCVCKHTCTQFLHATLGTPCSLVYLTRASCSPSCLLQGIHTPEATPGSSTR